jgi:hypothetical protein
MFEKEKKKRCGRVQRYHRQERYFVLNDSGLVYYKDKKASEGSHWRGWIPKKQMLHVGLATAGKGSEEGRRLNLRLQGHKRVFELMAENKECCAEWVRLINRAITRPGDSVECMNVSVPKEKLFVWNVVDGVRLCALETSKKDAVPIEPNAAVWNEECTYAFPGNISMVSYAPHIFQDLRHRLGICLDDYLSSWTYTPESLPVLELGAGRSGSLFLTSSDGMFVLKSIPPAEFHSLKGMLLIRVLFLCR